MTPATTSTPPTYRITPRGHAIPSDLTREEAMLLIAPALERYFRDARRVQITLAQEWGR